MNDEEIRTLLNRRPFEPIELFLSDGRVVLIRHPEQAAMSRRNIYIALAKVRRGEKLATPGDSQTVASEWMLINLIHIVGAEPANGRANGKPPRGRKNKRG